MKKKRGKNRKDGTQEKDDGIQKVRTPFYKKSMLNWHVYEGKEIAAVVSKK